MNRRLLMLLLFWMALPVYAHKIKIFATTDGATITGSLYSPGGGGLAGQELLVTAAKTKVGTVRTDHRGQFSYKPEQRVEHTFVYRSDDGHQAQFTVVPGDPAIASGEGGEGVDAGLSGENDVTAVAGLGDAEPLRAVVEEAVHRQVAPLREELNAFKDRVRFTDILGGMGYILGLAGWAALLKSRSAR